MTRNDTKEQLLTKIRMHKVLITLYQNMFKIQTFVHEQRNSNAHRNLRTVQKRELLEEKPPEAIAQPGS